MRTGFEIINNNKTNKRGIISQALIDFFKSFCSCTRRALQNRWQKQEDYTGVKMNNSF